MSEPSYGFRRTLVGLKPARYPACPPSCPCFRRTLVGLKLNCELHVVAADNGVSDGPSWG